MKFTMAEVSTAISVHRRALTKWHERGLLGANERELRNGPGWHGRKWAIVIGPVSLFAALCIKHLCRRQEPLERVRELTNYICSLSLDDLEQNADQILVAAADIPPQFVSADRPTPSTRQRLFVVRMNLAMQELDQILETLEVSA